MPQRFRLDLFAGSLCALGLLVCLSYFVYVPTPADAPPSDLEATAPPSPEPVVTYDRFGIEHGQYHTENLSIQRNQTFSTLLERYELPLPSATLAEQVRPAFDVRYLQAGKTLRVYAKDDAARLIIYERDPINYVLIDLRDGVRAEARQRPVTLVERTVEGIIEGSPYETLVRQGANPALAAQLADVFAWQIDFYRIQRGDRFNFVYEEKQIDGEAVGLGRILAAHFEHGGERYEAYYFNTGDHRGYYDAEGQSTRLAFLKAPLKYSRISSRYTLRRFHPVQKRYKAHLGTDYAAPHGTPIRATGDGTVLKAGYARYNGNYVKIRHNGTYSTGYLHMSRIAKGIKAGTRVKQGDVIGYVGSTGLATGPHLCYRFWKDGKQVDPYKQDLPSADPIGDDYRLAFESVKLRYLETLEPSRPFVPVMASTLSTPTLLAPRS